MLFRRKPDIDGQVERFRAAPGALLLDARSPEEYAEGHIPGSLNLSLSDICDAEARIPEKATPLFVYCLSGARSAQMVLMLQAMGYQNVCNIGGIQDYTGALSFGMEE